MGRRKIAIEYIPEVNKRNTCFLKRKAGILKKAKELSILCGVEICMGFFKDDDIVSRYVSNGDKTMLERTANSNSTFETNETIDKTNTKDDDERTTEYSNFGLSDEEEQTAVDKQFLEIMPDSVLRELGYEPPTNRQRTKSCPSEHTPHMVVDLNLTNQRNQNTPSCSYSSNSQVHFQPHVNHKSTIESVDNLPLNIKNQSMMSQFDQGNDKFVAEIPATVCNPSAKSKRPVRPSFLELSDPTKFSQDAIENNSSNFNLTNIESPLAITTPDFLNLLSTPTLSTDSFFPQTIIKDPSPLKANEVMLNVSDLPGSSSGLNRLLKRSASDEDYFTQVDKSSAPVTKNRKFD